MELFCDNFEGYAVVDDAVGKWHAVAADNQLATVNGRRWWRVGGTNFASFLARSVSPTVPNQILVSARFIFSFSYPQFIALRHGSAVMLAVAYDNMAARLRVTRGSTVLITSSMPVSNAEENHVELRAILSTMNGSVELRVNGALAGSFVGNTINAGSLLDNVAFMVPNQSGGVFVTDVVMKDYGPSLGDVVVKRIPLAGNGAQNDWTPSAGENYAAVNDPVRDDNTYVASSTPGARDLYTLADPGIKPGSVIHFVQLAARARKEDGGARALKLLTRSGVEEAESGELALPTSYTYVAHGFPVNPETGLPWTPAALAAMQPGVECV